MRTTIKVAGTEFNVEAKAITASMFRVSVAKEGAELGSALNRYGFLTEPQGKAKGVKEKRTGASCRCGTAAAELRVETVPAGLSFGLSDNSGETLTSGALSIGKKDGFVFDFDIARGERFYGLGAQTSARIEHRGTVADLWTRSCAANVPVPLLLSSRGYAIFVNTTFRSTWDIGSAKGNRLSVRVAGGNPDLYLIQGATLKELVMRYTELSGRPMLPPKWTFGLWFICHTEANQRDAVQDAAGFRERQIPCDIIGLEPGWMEKFYDQSVAKAWNSTRFYVPSWAKHRGAESFIAALKRMGFKLELWLCNDYDLSEEAERQARRRLGRQDQGADNAGDPSQEGIQLGKTVRLDPLTVPGQPWFEHLSRFVDQGADFFKQDEAHQVLEHPDRRWANGMLDEEMHNLYSLLYVQQMHDGFKAHTGRRPCCFTSVGFAGLQRYTGTWTGDVGGKAETLVSILNLALCGHSTQTCDMSVRSKDGIHYGFLLPWAHVNSWADFAQPWFLGDELYPIFCDYARLRSSLIPYLYTYAHIASTTGVPMVRPVVMEFPDEPTTTEALRQYLLGSELLVTAFTDKVRLPKGLWHDFWTGEIVRGGRTVAISPPPNRGGGLFVRENSILPLGPITDYVGQRTDAGYTFHIYVDEGGQAAFSVYDDDGVSFEYERGTFSLHAIEATRQRGAVAISLPPGLKVDAIVLHLDKPPVKVTVDGVPAPFEPSGMNAYRVLTIVPPRL
jgi:alpha-glucosidase (family GH31 glycosyl hydrolase)